jgi:hypothetical protein
MCSPRFNTVQARQTSKVDAARPQTHKTQMLRRVALACLVTLSLGAGARANEGMWTFDNFPKAKLKAAHGLEVTDQWLHHVMRGAVRLSGCSASFVSSQGLVATNHHCVVSCLQQLSTPQRDLVAAGFAARTGADEPRCPELEATELIDITDVTARIKTATKGLDGEKYQDARKAAQAAIEKECQTSDALRCDVVSLYHGGVYALYKYKRFQDVRLVFAPEKAIAFFGGDPDNFNFPRYDLDVSFARVYENGKPAATEDFLRWSARGARDGDLTFVAGNPGGTNRQLTVAELEYVRDVQLPDTLMMLSELRGLLTEFSRESKEHRRIAETSLFGVENSFKALRGRWQALRDARVFATKVAAEKSLRAKLARTRSAKELGPAWDQIARAQAKLRDIRKPFNYEERGLAFGGRLFGIARTLVRGAAELPLPNEKRLEELRDAALPMVKQRLFSAAPIYDDLERLNLTYSLTKLREELGADHPFVKKVLGKESPEELAARLLAGTQLRDVATRRKLWDGGAAAVEAALARDPLLALAKLVDPDARAIRKIWESEVDAVVRKNTELVARARFEIEGTNSYPDATSTLRLSYGTVKGFEEAGRPVPPITTLAGAFERATGRDPYALPATWLAAKGKLALSTPFDVITTNDIIGGNSGSPLIDKDGEQVGVIFDGNIHSLGGDFFYDPLLNRAVAVESTAISEALGKIFGAQRVLDELAGKTK